MPKKHHVPLTDERTELCAMTRNGTIVARNLVRARALFHADDGLTDEAIAAALQIGTATGGRLRKRFLEGGWRRRGMTAHCRVPSASWTARAKPCWSRGPAAPRRRAPHWTTQLLADTLVKLQIVETISDETVRCVLKSEQRTCWTVRGALRSGVPRVCLDERPCQVLSETRTPIPAAADRLARVDHAYQHEGTCNLFMLFEPLTSWRHVSVTGWRTAAGYAHWLRALVDGHHPEATLISIVQNNLNTHTPAALHAALVRQCLSRRLTTSAAVGRAVAT
jgi:hypothetical protein